MEWKKFTYLAASGAHLRFRAPADWKAEYDPPDPNPEDPSGDYLGFYPPEDVLRWGSYGHFWLMTRRDTRKPNAGYDAVEAIARCYAGVSRDKLVPLELLPGGRYLHKSTHQFHHPLERRPEVSCFWHLIQPTPDALCWAMFGFRGEAARYDPTDKSLSPDTALLDALEQEFRAACFIP